MKEIRVHLSLRRLLQLRGTTVSRLSRSSGVPHSTLSTWLLPDARPSDPVQIAAVARALGTSMHHLVFDELEEEADLEALPSEVALEGVYRIRLERIGPPKRRGRPR
jgi:transcriptional regulator with XRE-family HTH domain